MENGKQIKVELYPHIAPNTVNNFKNLIITITMMDNIPIISYIRIGCPQGTNGGPDTRAKEFSSNGSQ